MDRIQNDIIKDLIDMINSNYIDNIINTISETPTLLFPPILSIYTDIIENEENPKKVLTKNEFDKLSKGHSTKTCNICLEVNNDSVVLPCGHFFHENCIDKWLLEKSNVCPTCRKEVNFQ